MLDRITRASTLFAIATFAVGAMAQDSVQVSTQGSSGNHFAEQAEACSAAQADAKSAARRECKRQSGRADGLQLGECVCEQGGFEDAEWLCEAKAVLTCSMGDAPEKTSTATPTATLDLPSDMSRDEVLEREFQRRGRSLPSEGLADRFKGLCDNGWELACKFDSWHKPSGASLDDARPILNDACNSGDRSACLAYGWAREALGDKTKKDEDYKAAARKYKSLCDADKNQYACYEYGKILFNSLGVKADPRLGIRRWTNACDAGEGAACTVLSKIYRDGVNTKVDLDKSKSFAKKACDASDPFGCIELAKASNDEATHTAALFDLCRTGGLSTCWSMSGEFAQGERAEFGEATRRNTLSLGCQLGHSPSCAQSGTMALELGEEAEAARLYRIACKGGEVEGCAGVVEMIMNERTPGSIKADQYAYEVACSKGQNGNACAELGLALLDGEQLKKDTARARAILKHSCVNKNSPARTCFVLGDLFETGKGGDRDRTLASNYFKWACAQGWGEACERRGDLLDRGVGVRENDEEAVVMYQNGCDAGSPSACHKAAVLLDEGSNIERDAPRALKLYDEACEKGIGEACLRLGKLHVEGAAGSKDEASAVNAFERAVALSNVEAHRRLARLLWNGLGTKKDKKRAKELCATACQADDPIACRGPAWQREGD